MTDPFDDRAERAFRFAFESRADELEPADLGVRRPRRRRLPLLAVAASLVLVATVATVATRSVGSGGDGPQVATEARATRTVSYRDVVVAVPADWDDGRSVGSDWCADGGMKDGVVGQREPYVELPPSGGVATMDILCTGPVPERLLAPHVTIGPAGVPVDEPSREGRLAVSPGSSGRFTTTARDIGSVRVSVTADAATAVLVEPILDSARQVEVDPNGCDVSSAIQRHEQVRPEPAFDVSDVTGVDSISVCQYDRSIDRSEPGLVGSRRLTDSDAEELLRGIVTAPAGGGPDRPSHCLSTSSYDDSDPGAVVVRLATGPVTHDLYLYYTSCVGHGIDDGTTVRALTVDNCRPVFAEAPVTISSGDQALFRVCVG